MASSSVLYSHIVHNGVKKNYKKVMIEFKLNNKQIRAEKVET
jgi:hypothetical protein